jgi:hypothetical protein
MAVITIIVRDAVGPEGESGITVEMQSQDPGMPIKDGTLDFEAATPSQNLAFGAVMEIAGLAEANELLTSDTQEY